MALSTRSFTSYWKTQFYLNSHPLTVHFDFKCSKFAPLTIGCTIYSGCSVPWHMAVTTLQIYIIHRVPTPGSLFREDDTSPTSAQINFYLSYIFTHLTFTGTQTNNSFRIGVAAATATVPNYLIRILDWQPSVDYQRYTMPEAISDITMLLWEVEGSPLTAVPPVTQLQPPDCSLELKEVPLVNGARAIQAVLARAVAIRYRQDKYWLHTLWSALRRFPFGSTLDRCQASIMDWVQSIPGVPTFFLKLGNMMKNLYVCAIWFL